MKKLRVLYVEDESDVYKAMTRWFQARDCEVIHFSSPTAAEEALQKDAVDFVLTDWNLGMQTGERVARKAMDMKVPVRIYSGRDCPQKLSDLTSVWMTKGGKDFHPTLDALLTEILGQ